MRIPIIALGSRGDVQPFIALARGLEKAGHCVSILAAKDYESLVASYGISFVPVIGRIDQLMDRELVYRFFEHNGNPLGMAVQFLKGVAPVILQLMQDCWDACNDAEALICSSLGIFAGHSIAEKLRVPSFLVHMHPNARTRTIPSMFFPVPRPEIPFSWAFNLFTHKVAEQGLWQLLRSQLNDARRSVLGLPPVSVHAAWQSAAAPASHTLFAYSTKIAPRPADWEKRIPITGYWFLDSPLGFQPTEDLYGFLKSDPPPIYVGFGSNLVGRYPEQMTALLVETISEMRLRAVLHTGWGDIANGILPPEIFKIGAIPHPWLLPRVAAAIHHGAAGTTAAVLCAGLPSVVVPFFGDQSFWAQRLYELGAAPEPIPRPELSKDRLRSALRCVLEQPAYRHRAIELGDCLRAEDGVGNAIRFIQQQLSTRKQSA